jgi:hypothetical protein
MSELNLARFNAQFSLLTSGQGFIVTAITTKAVHRHSAINTSRSILKKKAMESPSTSRTANNHSGSFAYGLGFLGAFIYFVQGVTTFWLGVIAFFKAAFWPAFLVYYLLEFLKR